MTGAPPVSEEGPAQSRSNRRVTRWVGRVARRGEPCSDASAFRRFPARTVVESCTSSASSAGASPTVGPDGPINRTSTLRAPDRCKAGRTSAVGAPDEVRSHLSGPIDEGVGGICEPCTHRFVRAAYALVSGGLHTRAAVAGLHFRGLIELHHRHAAPTLLLSLLALPTVRVLPTAGVSDGARAKLLSHCLLLRLVGSGHRGGRVRGAGPAAGVARLVTRVHSRIVVLHLHAKVTNVAAAEIAHCA
jgi:hypothetical protein